MDSEGIRVGDPGADEYVRSEDFGGLNDCVWHHCPRHNVVWQAEPYDNMPCPDCEQEWKAMEYEQLPIGAQIK